MIDPQVLVKIKFNQISERKAWQGINALYCGVPGTSTLNPYEGILMFQQEKDYIDSNSKIIDIMREIHDLLHINQIQQTKGNKSPITEENQVQQYSISNSQFIKFKFQELLHQYSKTTQNSGQQFSPNQPSKQSINFDYSETIIKKINAISGSQSQFSQNHNYNSNGQNSKICLYKMLKCESKLVRFIFELNGLIHTDRHDWNVLWTHTQGKTYFYERLNQNQKLNHFPSSTEITRKDRMAINIKRMQEKYSKAYFNFIPETFVLPDQFNEFETYFEIIENRNRNMNNGGISLTSSVEGNIANHNSNGNGKNIKRNLWIVKPSCSSRGRGIYIIENLKQVPRHESIVVSRYIESPLLLYGHKFDLRIYVVITCYDPLKIYVYREGLVRFASEKYDISKFNDATKFSHLTNYSINKKNENYIQNENAEDDDNGFKWSLSAMNEHFESQGIDVNLMWSKIYDVIIKSLISIEDTIKNQMKKSSVNRNNCYELFGYDIILDNNLNPWLLEVNLSPSLAFESPLDLKIKGNLLKDTFNLIGVKKPNSEFNKPTLSQNQYNTEKNNSKPTKKQFQTSQINNTFNPNKTFTKDMNNQQNEMHDSIMNEIMLQIKNMQELTWHQKEYLNSYTQLHQKQKEIIIESILELKRRGNFIRIYPNKNTDFYDCFFQNSKQTQQVLYQFLYNEQFISFKNLKKTNKIFNINLKHSQKGQTVNGTKSPIKSMNATMIMSQKSVGNNTNFSIFENSKIKDLVFCILEYLKRYQQISQGMSKTDLQKLNQQLYHVLSDESLWSKIENINTAKNYETTTIEQSQTQLQGFAKLFKQRLELLQKLISFEQSSSKSGKEKQMQSNSKNRLKAAGNIITQINKKQLDQIFNKFKNLSNLQLTETLIKKINGINQDNQQFRDQEEEDPQSIKKFDQQLLYHQNESNGDSINLLDYMQFNGNPSITIDDKQSSKKQTLTATLQRQLGINGDLQKKSSIQQKSSIDTDLQSQMSQDLLQKVKQLNQKLTIFKNSGKIQQQSNIQSQLYQVSQMLEQQNDTLSQEREQSNLENRNEYTIMGGNQISKEKIERDKSSLKVLEEILEEQNGTKQRKSQSNFFKHRYSKDHQSVANEKDQEYNQVSPSYQPFISPFQMFNQTFTNLSKINRVDQQYQARDSIKYSSQSNRRAIQKQNPGAAVSINTIEKSNKIYEIYGPQNSMKARLINQKNSLNPNQYGLSSSTNNSFTLINQKKRRDKSQRNSSYNKDHRELMMMSGGEIQSNNIINPMLLPGILNHNK